jgi:nitrite reductase (NADH) large subunit
VEAGAASAVRIVIVGAGAAGVTTAEAARRANPAAEIRLLSKEPALPYHRINLTRYLAGDVKRDALPLHPESWYAEQKIDLRRGVAVKRIDPAGHAVALADGGSLPYDRLVLATGADAFVPPVPGAARAGVFTLRTIDDADRILEAARPGARVVCVGGGLLGLETAGALARRKADVTVLENAGHLMHSQLDPAGGAALAGHLAAIGVRLRTNARAKELAGPDRVAEVRLEDGASLPADVVILATGVRPTATLARDAGLAVKRGVVVDDSLGTSAAGVYAAGDAAEHRGVLYGSWFVAQGQGQIAGMNAAGLHATFGGVPRAFTLKVLDVDVVSLGVFSPPDRSHVSVAETAGTTYRCFVFREGRLVGANFVGDASAAGAARKAIESGRDLSDLLAKKPTAGIVAAYLSGTGG